MRSQNAGLCDILPLIEMSLEELLGQGANVNSKEVFLHPSFSTEVDSLHAQPALADFLASESRMLDALNYMYGNNIDSSLSYEEQCRLAFNASLVLASVETKLVQIFMTSKPLKRLFFSQCNVESEEHSTALGYFENTYKTLLGELNDDNQGFAKLLADGYVSKVFPMVVAMSDAHRNILKSIFDHQSECIVKLKGNTFDYFMYNYLNEKIEVAPGGTWKRKYRNARMLVNALTESELKFRFKEKYIPELFTINRIKHQEVEGFVGEVFRFKLAVLRYLAKTEQIRTAPRILQLFDSWKKLCGPKTSISFLVEILEFLRAISKASEFQSNPPQGLLDKLMMIWKEIHSNDIIHIRISEILSNLIQQINSDKKFLQEISEFLVDQLSNAKQPGDEESQLNPISPIHFAPLLEKIEINPENEKLLALKEKFFMTYLKPEEEQEVEHSSIVFSELHEILSEDLDMVQPLEINSRKVSQDIEEQILKNEQFASFNMDEIPIGDMDPYTLPQDLERSSVLREDDSNRKTINGREDNFEYSIDSQSAPRPSE